MKREIVNHLAGSMARDKDAIIRLALNKAIGSEDWTLEDLDGKVLFNRFPDGVEALVYDGIELILFYPLKTEVVQDGDSHILKVIEPYRVLA